MAEVNHLYDEELTQVDNTFGAANKGVGMGVASIDGSSLSANTKYLCIAKAVFGINDAGTVTNIGVYSGDEQSEFDSSDSSAEMTYSTDGEGLGYFWCHSFTTSISPGDVEIRIWNGDTSSWADQGSLLLLDLDDLGQHTTEDWGLGASDPDLVWTDDANARDGSESTYAYTTTTGNSATNYLQLNSTNFSGTAPKQVEFRVLYELTGTSPTAAFYPRETSVNPFYVAGFVTYMPVSGTGKKWTPWTTIRRNSGPWTEGVLQDMDIRLALTAGSELRIFKVEYRYTDVYLEWIEPSTDQGEISSTTWGTTDVSITGSQQTASVEYLVLGYVRHQPGSTGVNYHVRLRGHNGTAQQQLTYHSAEGEDTGEYRVVGVMGRSVGSTLNAIAIQSYEDAANGNWHGFGAYLIAIDVSAFADFDYSFATTGTTVSNAITSLETTGDVTPTTAGNHLVLGRYNYTTGGNDSRIAAWLREDVSHTSDQSFSSPNTYEVIYGGTSGGNEAVGQSIACGQTQTLYAIRAETVTVGGTPTDSLGCRIRTGSMTGTIVGTADNPATDGNQFTNGGYLFKFNGGVSVSSGTTYYVEWYRTGARDATNFWRIRSNSGGGYSGGTNYVKSGDSWSSGTRDILFEFPSQNLGEWVGGDSRSYQTQGWDPTDGETAIAMWRSYRDAVAYNTELVGARHNSDSNATTEYEFLAVLNLNLVAAAAPVFPRRQLTTTRM